jgi:hypothetical protein
MQILHWDVIDVLGERNGVARPTCFHCGKAAMWHLEAQYACSKHCPKTRIPTKTSLSKLKIEDLQEKARELKMETIPSKKGELVNAVYTQLETIGWRKFSGGSAVKHAPVLDLCGDIVACLDRRGDWWKQTDLVVIENQRDRRMFAVQAMLHMYFVREGLRTKGVSAVHKLSNIFTLDSTATYKGRIVHCEQLMPANQRAFFKSHKKKDDLADSFLQGLWFLEH